MVFNDNPQSSSLIYRFLIIGLELIKGKNSL